MKQVKYFLSILLIIALTSGSTWGQWIEENITNNGFSQPETSASHALDILGNVHVAYVGDKDPKKRKTIYELFYDNNIGGSFSSREQITSGQFNSLGNVRIAVGSDVHIVFTAATENGNPVLYYIKDSSGSWSTPLAISQTGLRAFGPNFRLSSLGDAHVVYSAGQSDGSPPTDIFYTENSSGSFSTPLNLTADPLFSGIGEQAAVALDGLDQVHIAFEVGIWDGIELYSTDLHDIYYTNNVGGSLLANMVRIAVLEDIREEKPSLAVDGAGNTHIAYKKQDLEQPIIANKSISITLGVVSVLVKSSSRQPIQAILPGTWHSIIWITCTSSLATNQIKSSMPLILAGVALPRSSSPATPGQDNRRSRLMGVAQHIF